jgi:hypothetical protein
MLTLSAGFVRLGGRMSESGEKVNERIRNGDWNL